MPDFRDELAQLATTTAPDAELSPEEMIALADALYALHGQLVDRAAQDTETAAAA